MKTWKREHLDKLRKDVPEAVIEGALRIIETLDRHYGEDRDVDLDLGGYVEIFPEPHGQEDYEALLSSHHLRQTDREHRETLCQDGATTWIAELFLCGSDYHVVVIRREAPSEGTPKKGGANGHDQIFHGGVRLRAGNHSRG